MPTAAAGSPVPIQAEAVRRWLRERDASVDTVEVGSRQALTGGASSPLVERVALTAHRTNGQRPSLVDVVAKRAFDSELLTMREIGSLSGTTTFAELIDAGQDADGPWVVMPFYPGAVQPADAEPPAAIYADLARLHLRYLGCANRLPTGIPRVDMAFCLRALLDGAPAGIRRAERAAPHPVHTRALKLLHRWAYDARIQAGLELLPATLLHGDVWGRNVVVSEPNPPRLVDWGCARIGPAMLDVALSAAADSRGVTAYLDE